MYIKKYNTSEKIILLGKHCTVHLDDFELNCKPIQPDFRSITVQAARVQNIFYVKSQIKVHRIHQLDSLAYFACDGRISQADWLADSMPFIPGFQKYTFSEALKNAL